MGGKGSEGSSMPAVLPQAQDQDSSMILAQMAQMGSMMSAMSQMSQQQPQMPTVPVISSAANIDWTEKQDQLKAKLKASDTLDNTRRKGRTDTILTSPLLDEADTEVSTSILAGK